MVYSRGKLGLLVTGALLLLGVPLLAGCTTPPSTSDTTSSGIPSSASTVPTAGSGTSSTVPEAWLGTTSTTSSPPYTDPAAVFPAQMPSDFGLRAAYGVTAKNVMDTFAGTFTTPFSPKDTGMFVTPSMIYRLEWAAGDFSAIPIVWDDGTSPPSPKRLPCAIGSTG